MSGSRSLPAMPALPSNQEDPDIALTPVGCCVEGCRQTVELQGVCCNQTWRIRALGWFKQPKCTASSRIRRKWFCPEHASDYGFVPDPQKLAAECHKHLCPFCSPLPSPATVSLATVRCADQGCGKYVYFGQGHDCCNEAWRLRAQGWVRSTRLKWRCPDHAARESQFEFEQCCQYLCPACASSASLARSSASSSSMPLVSGDVTMTSVGALCL